MSLRLEKQKAFLLCCISTPYCKHKQMKAAHKKHKLIIFKSSKFIFSRMIGYRHVGILRCRVQEVRVGAGKHGESV